jgi:CRISPR-associated protein Csm4
MKLIKFAARKFAKFHFGEDGLDNSLVYFPSPSLFSAIANNYVKLYGENDLEKLLTIKISSLYPGYKNTYFIPRPITKINLPTNVLDENPKIPKKISFVSFEILKENNRGDIEFSKNQLVNGFLFSSSEIKKYGEIEEELIFTDLEDKVTLSRISDSTEKTEEGSFAPYFVYFFYVNSKGLFFYFLLDDSLLEEDIKARLESSIRLIQNEGLGGERATGSGLFESVDISDSANFYESYIKDIQGLQGDKQFISLSTVIPKDNDEFEKARSYLLVKRGGFIYQPGFLSHKKKDVYAIADGSVFDEEIEGNVVDVSPVPETKAYQFGRFFGIPFLDAEQRKDSNDEQSSEGKDEKAKH